MKPFSTKELNLAFEIWLRNYEHRASDAEVIPFQSVAEKMGVTRSGYSQLEASEEEGTITFCRRHVVIHDFVLVIRGEEALHWQPSQRKT